ncbi:GNAT family N-acetyltransferase [Paenibacillus sp. M1]|uniref:GNAT family N-acetyltransferase n=1 Tax=Paenibacillus haidiansis TaxID=1574488 RepID=A0ABU7VMN7_9BACL
MRDLHFMMDYKNQEAVRKSLFALAESTFGISFEAWYQKGFWNETYIPYSYVDGKQVIANVSVNILDWIIDGETRKAVQIGTVMTRPDYRNRGLSSSLLAKVIEEYENRCDWMYLFANESVLDFYPKYGFQPVEEKQFSMDYVVERRERRGRRIRKLDVNDSADLATIYRLAQERIPNSRHFDTANSQGIFMFYCLNVFSEDLYYLEDKEIIAVCRQENGRIDLFDIVSGREFDLAEVLDRLAEDHAGKVVFHYTPDHENLNLRAEKYEGNMFVRAKSQTIVSADFKHPVTGIA